MAWFTNQQHIRNLRYTSVSDAQTQSSNARDTDACFVFETKKSYYYEHWSTAVIDWLSVLSANGGAGRWITISPISTTETIDQFTLINTDITNWYITLSQVPDLDKIILFTIRGQN